MKARLWNEYMRACWHGLPLSFEAWLDLTWTDRWFARRALDDLIERANEAGAGRPDDHRR